MPQSVTFTSVCPRRSDGDRTGESDPHHADQATRVITAAARRRENAEAIYSVAPMSEEDGVWRLLIHPCNVG